MSENSLQLAVVAGSDDLTLVHASKSGDIAAFEELVARYTVLIFRVAMPIVGSREDAEDIVQETFLKAFKHLQGFEERARFSTWLTKIAVNTALKRRDIRRSMTISMDQEADEGGTLADKIADWKPNPEQLYGKTELRKILQRALVSLPASYRVVFLLRDVEGLSTAETADILRLSISKVKMRLFRARLKLRECLSQYFARDSYNGSSLSHRGFEPEPLCGRLSPRAKSRAQRGTSVSLRS